MVWVLRLIRDLEIVPAEYFKKLVNTDDIWEVRIHHASQSLRLLGFFYNSQVVVLTNGFAEKKQKTPLKEISLAEQRKRDFLERNK